MSFSAAKTPTSGDMSRFQKSAITSQPAATPLGRRSESPGRASAVDLIGDDDYMENERDRIFATDPWANPLTTSTPSRGRSSSVGRRSVSPSPSLAPPADDSASLLNRPLLKPKIGLSGLRTKDDISLPQYTGPFGGHTPTKFTATPPIAVPPATKRARAGSLSKQLPAAISPGMTASIALPSDLGATLSKMTARAQRIHVELWEAHPSDGAAAIARAASRELYLRHPRERRAALTTTAVVKVVEPSRPPLVSAPALTSTSYPSLSMTSPQEEAKLLSKQLLSSGGIRGLPAATRPSLAQASATPAPSLASARPSLATPAPSLAQAPSLASARPSLAQAPSLATPAPSLASARPSLAQAPSLAPSSNQSLLQLMTSRPLTTAVAEGVAGRPSISGGIRPSISGGARPSISGTGLGGLAGLSQSEIHTSSTRPALTSASGGRSLALPTSGGGPSSLIASQRPSLAASTLAPVAPASLAASTPLKSVAAPSLFGNPLGQGTRPARGETFVPQPAQFQPLPSAVPVSTEGTSVLGPRIAPIKGLFSRGNPIATATEAQQEQLNALVTGQQPMSGGRVPVSSIASANRGRPGEVTVVRGNPAPGTL